MSEELLQRGLDKKPEKIGKYDFYNIGATSIKGLKEHKIIRNLDYGSIERKKVDGIIVNQKNVIAIIENKLPKEFNTKAKQQKAINQELEVAKKLNCKILIATDTKETIWINVLTGKRIIDENNCEIKINWNPIEVTKNDYIANLIDKINLSINETNNKLLPIEFVNPTDLAKQIWQDIWSATGASPEICLYTFIELFIFKYLSDLEVLKKGSLYNFYTLYNMYEVDDEDIVLSHYSNTIRKHIKDLFPKDLIDDTTIINGMVFASDDKNSSNRFSGVFKTVLERFYKYPKLENINSDFKSQLFESFLKESISQKNLGQFFTPIKVIHAIEMMAKDDIKENITICDPACGVGKFLLEPIKNKINTFFKIKNNKVESKIKLVGFDKGLDTNEQKTIIMAKANMLIYFSELIKENPHLTKEFSNLFNETFTLKTDSILGTLSEPIENEYDLILTNPPYVTSGSSNLKNEISKNLILKNHYKVNAVGVEGLFMEWIIKALKQNGKAYVIVPDGIFNRTSDNRLRKFIKDECFIDAIISLPLNTFFTTPKKTYILAITKKQNIEQIQTTPVFTYLVSEIGESRDNYRFNIEQNDLNEAIILFNMFKGAKNYFKTDDKRCKIQPIDKFISDNHWSIDKWWSEKEKIELGILEEDKKIQFNEFPFLLDTISNNILDFKDEILELNQTESITQPIYKDFTISDIFDLAPIKGLTKSFINSNKGIIPVYGGRITEKPIGYIEDDLKGVKYFENCLAWNREGSVGYVFWHKHKFTTNDHHRPMILKEIYRNKINLDYARFAIEKVLLSQGFQWSQTASKEKVAKLTFKLPINQDNEINISIQNSIAEKNKKIEEIKKLLNKELEDLEKIIIEH